MKIDTYELGEDSMLQLEKRMRKLVEETPRDEGQIELVLDIALEENDETYERVFQIWRKATTKKAVRITKKDISFYGLGRKKKV